MKRILRGLAALSALACVCVQFAAPVRAQGVSDPNQWIVKGGVTLPREGTPKRVSSTWLTGGLEYQAGNPDGQRVSSIEALFSTANDNIQEDFAFPVSVEYSMLSLMYNYRIRQVDPSGVAIGNVLFYGAGVGAQAIWAKIQDENDSTNNFDDDRIFAGANVFIGYEIGANLEIEAKYQMVFGKVQDQRMNTLQLLFGFKF